MSTITEKAEGLPKSPIKALTEPVFRFVFAGYEKKFYFKDRTFIHLHNCIQFLSHEDISSTLRVKLKVKVLKPYGCD